MSRTYSLVALVVFLAASGAACGAPPDGQESVGESGAAATESNDQIAFDFFLAEGLIPAQAAGIVGNLDQESGMSPTVAEYGGGPGRGIAQWSTGGRWDSSPNDNVEWYAAQRGESATSLTLQLEFAWYELTSFPSYGLASLEQATTVDDAAQVFASSFEICGECDQSSRDAYAEEAFDAYGSDTISAGSGTGASASGSGTGATSSSGGGSSSAGGCYSNTLEREMPMNACVQERANALWYQCDEGKWVDRWTDPTACDGVYPLP